MFYNYKKQILKENFNIVNIKLASPRKILSWSYGEIKSSETINYRTFKPENDGLFCCKIFGPLKDYECLCGKYKNYKNKIICEKCNVEIIESQSRRERMGHIKLYSSSVHIWFFKYLPSYLSLILDINQKKLKKIIYYESYIIINANKTFLKDNEIIKEKEYFLNLKKYKNNFVALTGSNAIKKLLKSLNIINELKKLYKIIKNKKNKIIFKKSLNRFKILKSFKKKNIKLKWMILKILPILPPDLRPLVCLDNDKFATSDLNILYRRVINCNNRLKRSINLDLPQVAINNNKCLLQKSIDALLDNSQKGKIFTDSNKRALKSLSDIIKGKTGRFRQNLLGKRVDYSGRSVIIVNPNLNLNECGLPKLMALELFRPIIYNKLKLLSLTKTNHKAKKIVDFKQKGIWLALKLAVKNYFILLNRAPTLHRLGIQSFKPKLINGKAIEIHPLVCTAFNADFDGDQMAVHIPLTFEAKKEASTILLSSNNILFPSSGDPSISLTQEMVLGIYYSTIMINDKNKNCMLFFNIEDAIYAYENKIINLSTNIFFFSNEKKNKINFKKKYKTVIGRIMIYDILPKKIPFSLINKNFDKKEISNLINIFFRKYGKYYTIKFVQKFMKLGFYLATKSGISICINDMIIPKNKKYLLKKAEFKIKKIKKKYNLNVISNIERFDNIINIWSNIGNNISKEMMKELEYKNIFYFKKIKNINKYVNSVYLIAKSGARGSENQIRQLSGMRGLMSKPNGNIIKTPIIENFREGLSIFQYFISTHGARKGLADTSLKTANSGYLTRRLVDVSQDLIIKEKDCKTNVGITLKALTENGEVIKSLYSFILGRVLLENIICNKTQKIFYKIGTLINENIAKKIINLGINRVKVRTPVTCNTYDGLCSKCYGRDLSKGFMVKIGEAVGILAAQSIGEPGTQLTMRTFHIGGTIFKKKIISSIRSKYDGIVSFSKNLKFITLKENKFIVVSYFNKLLINNTYGRILEQFKISYGSLIFVKNNTFVKKGTLITTWNPLFYPIISEYNGIIKYIIYKKKNKFLKSNQIKIELNNEQNKFNESKFINFPENCLILVKNGQKIKKGDILAKIPIKMQHVKDITGGLPKISDLFEARKHKNKGILSKISGLIHLSRKFSNNIKIHIINKNGIKKTIIVSKKKHILVYNGKFVNKGELIVNGIINPHSVLKLSGIEKLKKFLINEIQKIYRSQDININDKHIEVILRQMLKKVKIKNPGDTFYTSEEKINRNKLFKINNFFLYKNKKPATYKNILLGITQSSLSTNSFISAASFQETIKILTKASILNKNDHLLGLKENIITGHLIPAGTGFKKK